MDKYNVPTPCNTKRIRIAFGRNQSRVLPFSITQIIIIIVRTIPAYLFVFNGVEKNFDVGTFSIRRTRLPHGIVHIEILVHIVEKMSTYPDWSRFCRTGCRCISVTMISTFGRRDSKAERETFSILQVPSHNIWHAAFFSVLQKKVPDKTGLCLFRKPEGVRWITNSERFLSRLKRYRLDSRH